MKITKCSPAMTAYPSAPSHLSERSKELWGELGPLRATTAGRRLLLQMALEHLDRADQAREIIAVDGPFQASTGRMTHAHPALKLERECRAEAAKLCKLLCLHHAITPGGTHVR